MWLWITLQAGVWLYGVHRICTEIESVLQGTIMSAHHFGGCIQKHYLELQELIQNCMWQEHNESAWELKS